MVENSELIKSKKIKIQTQNVEPLFCVNTNIVAIVKPELMLKKKFATKLQSKKENRLLFESVIQQAK